MDLTKEQIVMLNVIWGKLKDELIEFASKTRNKNITVLSSMNNIRNDNLKLLLKYTEQDAIIALEFVNFVIDNVINTKSISKTIEKVDTVYNVSDI